MPKNTSVLQLPTSPDAEAHIQFATEPNKFEDVEEVSRYVQRWRQILNLRDWSFSVRLVPLAEVPDQNGSRIATCQVDRTEMHCIISLIQARDYRYLKNCLSVYDMERTLVHEMLHCKWPTDWVGFSDEGYNSRWDDTIEFMVEQTSKSMVELERAYRLEIYGEAEHVEE